MNIFKISFHHRQTNKKYLTTGGEAPPPAPIKVRVDIDDFRLSVDPEQTTLLYNIVYFNLCDIPGVVELCDVATSKTEKTKKKKKPALPKDKRAVLGMMGMTENKI